MAFSQAVMSLGSMFIGCRELHVFFQRLHLLECSVSPKLSTEGEGRLPAAVAADEAADMRPDPPLRPQNHTLPIPPNPQRHKKAPDWTSVRGSQPSGCQPHLAGDGRILFAQAAVLAGFVSIAGGDEAEACDDLSLGEHELLWIEIAIAVGNGRGLIHEDEQGMDDHGAASEGRLVVDQGSAEVASDERKEGLHRIKTAGSVGGEELRRISGAGSLRFRGWLLG